MANIHSFFYSTDTDKQTLHRRIVPNSTQFEQQQDRWHDLRDFLVADLNEKTGLPICTWLQGSYKFETQVSPKNKKEEFDIDLGIYFKWESSRDTGTYSAKELKRLVQESLKVYASETADAATVLEPAKERCNRISFTEGFHIDVPVYHLYEQHDLRSLATESGKWEDSDPKAIYLWFRENFSDDDSNQVRRLIRYMKMWSIFNLKNPPSSILLTVLVAEAYKMLRAEDVQEDDMALFHLSKLIKARLTGTSVVNNPVDSTENLNRLSEEEYFLFLEKLDVLKNIADRAIDSDSEASAASIWSEAFKHFFPAPAEQTAKPSENKGLSKVLFVPQVRVIATSNQEVLSLCKNIARLAQERVKDEILAYGLQGYWSHETADYILDVLTRKRTEGGLYEYFDADYILHKLSHRKGTDSNLLIEAKAILVDGYISSIKAGVAALEDLVGKYYSSAEITSMLMPHELSKWPAEVQRYNEKTGVKLQTDSSKDNHSEYLKSYSEFVTGKVSILTFAR